MRRSRRNKNVVESIGENADETTAGLPPRVKRISKKQKQRKKKVFLAGLYLFGTIAIGMIGFELFQASRNMPTVQDQGVKETIISEANQRSDVQKELRSKPESLVEAPKVQYAAPISNVVSVTSTSAGQPALSPVQKPAAVQHAVSQPAPSTGQQKSQPTPNSINQRLKPVVQQAKKRKLIRHRVAAGETLFKLSRKYYGNGMGVGRIARQNHLNPDAPLPVGRVVYIPLR